MIILITPILVTDALLAIPPITLQTVAHLGSTSGTGTTRIVWLVLVSDTRPYNCDCTLRRGRMNWSAHRLIDCYKSPTILEDGQLSFRSQPHLLRVLPSPLDSFFLEFTFITVPSLLKFTLEPWQGGAVTNLVKHLLPLFPGQVLTLRHQLRCWTDKLARQSPKSP